MCSSSTSLHTATNMLTPPQVSSAPSQCSAAAAALIVWLVFCYWKVLLLLPDKGPALFITHRVPELWYEYVTHLKAVLGRELPTPFTDLHVMESWSFKRVQDHACTPSLQTFYSCKLPSAAHKAIRFVLINCRSPQLWFMQSSTVESPCSPAVLAAKITL